MGLVVQQLMSSAVDCFATTVAIINRCDALHDAAGDSCFGCSVDETMASVAVVLLRSRYNDVCGSCS
jgi:hypothetical protein